MYGSPATAFATFKGGVNEYRPLPTNESSSFCAKLASLPATQNRLSGSTVENE